MSDHTKLEIDLELRKTTFMTWLFSSPGPEAQFEFVVRRSVDDIVTQLIDEERSGRSRLKGEVILSTLDPLVHWLGSSALLEEDPLAKLDEELRATIAAEMETSNHDQFQFFASYSASEPKLSARDIWSRGLFVRAGDVSTYVQGGIYVNDMPVSMIQVMVPLILLAVLIGVLRDPQFLNLTYKALGVVMIALICVLWIARKLARHRSIMLSISRDFASAIQASLTAD